MANSPQCGTFSRSTWFGLLMLLAILVNMALYSVYFHAPPTGQENPNNHNLVLGEPNKCPTDGRDNEDLKIIIKESNKCLNDDGEKKDVFLLIMVTTAPENFAYRQAIRKTWGSISDVNGTRVTVMFKLGQFNITNRTLDEDIYDESVKFHDIVRDNFTDTYDNLTLKTIACLKWATRFCPHASYVMKADDNAFINIHRFVAHLRDESIPKVNFAEGGRQVNATPIRDTQNKWYISRSEFNQTVFPPFLSGHGYVMSADVAAKTFLASQSIRPIRLEDVYFGLCLQAAGINPTDSKSYYFNTLSFSYCKERERTFTWHPTNLTEMYNLWNIEIGKHDSCRVNMTR